MNAETLNTILEKLMRSEGGYHLSQSHAYALCGGTLVPVGHGDNPFRSLESVTLPEDAKALIVDTTGDSVQLHADGTDGEPLRCRLVSAYDGEHLYFVTEFENGQRIKGERIPPNPLGLALIQAWNTMDVDSVIQQILDESDGK